MSRQARGFTLIELMVALGMALVLTTSAVTVMVVAIRTQQEGTVRNEMARDAQLVLDTLARDLAYLGAGVPRGFEADTNGNVLGIGQTTGNIPSASFTAALAAKQLRPTIRIGQEHYLAFLGDAPYPNAELNGLVSIGQFLDEGSDVQDEFAVSSELTSCPPQVSASTSNYTCDTTDNSLLTDIGGSNCHGTATTQPTCPWGLNKWQKTGTAPYVPLIFGALDGTWYRRQWDPDGLAFSTAGTSERLLVHVEHWPSTAEADLPVNLFQSIAIGGGMGATIDRIFYSLEPVGSSGDCTAWPCRLMRRQCWFWDLGTHNPDDATFPKVGGTVMRSGSNPAGCTNADRGTPWETIASDIESFSFRYYGVDDLTADLAPLDAAESSRTRVIEVEMTLRRRIPGSNPARFFQHHARRRFWLENAGGLVTWPNRVAQSLGGCLDDEVNYPNECNPQ